MFSILFILYLCPVLQPQSWNLDLNVSLLNVRHLLIITIKPIWRGMQRLYFRHHIRGPDLPHCEQPQSWRCKYNVPPKHWHKGQQPRSPPSISTSSWKPQIVHICWTQKLYSFWQIWLQFRDLNWQKFLFFCMYPWNDMRVLITP